MRKLNLKSKEREVTQAGAGQGRIQPRVPAIPLAGLRFSKPANSEAPPPLPLPALRAPQMGGLQVLGPVKEGPREEWAGRDGFLDVRIEGVGAQYPGFREEK